MIRSFAATLVASALTLAFSAAPSLAQIPSAGLRLWLRADKGVSLDSTGRLTTWKDQSTHGRSFASSSATLRPAYAMDSNGNAHLRFDRRRQVDGTLNADLGPATVFALVRYRIPASDNDYLYSIGDRGGSGSQICLSRRSGDKAYHYDGRTQRIGPGTIPFGKWSVTTQIVGAGAGNTHELWRDGVQLMKTTAAAAYKAKGSRFQIGAWYSGYRFGGDLRELIVYDRVVTAAERKTIETWLANRRGGAAVLSIGQGCKGSGGRPNLFANRGSLPKLGTTFGTSVHNLPTAANTLALVALGFNDVDYQRVPLPIDLTGPGFTGCVLRVSLDILDPRVATNGRTAWSIPIPNDAKLEMQSFYLQILVIDRLANRAGITFSNSLAMTIGR